MRNYEENAPRGREPVSAISHRRRAVAGERVRDMMGLMRGKDRR